MNSYRANTVSVSKLSIQQELIRLEAKLESGSHPIEVIGDTRECSGGFQRGTRKRGGRGRGRGARLPWSEKRFLCTRLLASHFSFLSFSSSSSLSFFFFFCSLVYVESKAGREDPRIRRSASLRLPFARYSCADRDRFLHFQTHL